MESYLNREVERLESEHATVAEGEEGEMKVTEEDERRVKGLMEQIQELMEENKKYRQEYLTNKWREFSSGLLKLYAEVFIVLLLPSFLLSSYSSPSHNLFASIHTL